jgi:hypothetical protein
MLKAMDKLEKSVNDLLDRIQNQADYTSGPDGNRPIVWNGRGETREREAAELIRRAIERLKSL